MGTHTPWQGALMPSANTCLHEPGWGGGDSAQGADIATSLGCSTPSEQSGRTTELGQKRVSAVGEGVCAGCVCDTHTDSGWGFQPRARLLRLSGAPASSSTKQS